MTSRCIEPTGRIHHLKTWPAEFRLVRLGYKPFDLRPADRGFTIGDTLVLQEWLPDRERYTGQQCRRLVTCIIPGGQFGLAEGHVALGLAEIGRERIEHEHGVYVARREPRVEEVIGDDPAILVLFTHDLGKAAELAWPAWSERWENRRIGKPRRVWWRSVPGDPFAEGWAYHWHPATPGTRGAIPAVLFEQATYTEDCLTPDALAFRRGMEAVEVTG